MDLIKQLLTDVPIFTGLTVCFGTLLLAFVLYNAWIASFGPFPEEDEEEDNNDLTKYL